MDYYNTVKEKIANYLVRDEVVDTDEVISAYTLISILREQSKRLMGVEELKKGLLDKVNELYPNIEVNAKRRLFGKNRLKSHETFNRIYTHGDDENKSIRIGFETVIGKNTVLEKEFDYDGVFSNRSSKLRKEVYFECEEEINTIFNELEFFYKAIFKEGNDTKGNPIYDYTMKQVITTDLVEIDLGWEMVDGVFYTVKASPSINQTTERYYYGKENNLEKYIEENSETILKNTPIKVSELKPFFQIMINEYRKEKGKVKEKVSE